MAEYIITWPETSRNINKNIKQELIRCKDCKNGITDHDDVFCCKEKVWRDPYFFCAWGERS